MVLLCGNVFGTDFLGLGSNLNRASYPLQYSLAKDSLVAIKNGNKYIVYPKYTFKLPLRFFYKIHPELCAVMKNKKLGSLKNPFNKNLALMPRFKKGIKKSIITSNVITFRNLNHLQKMMPKGTYVYWQNKQFLLYLKGCNLKYNNEFVSDCMVNRRIKFRFLRALNRFRYRRIIWFKKIFKKRKYNQK